MNGEECRLKLHHVEPNAQLTNFQKTELIHASQVVLARHKQQMNGKTKKEKRIYRRWTNEEIYTLEVAVCLYGMNYSSLSEIFSGRPQRRNENQVLYLLLLLLFLRFSLLNTCSLFLQIRHFIRKRSQRKFQAQPLEVLIKNPPAGYIPPVQFAHLFPAKPLDRLSLKQQQQLSGEDKAVHRMNKLDSHESSLVTSTNAEELICERENKNNFNILVGLAAGYEMPYPSAKVQSELLETEILQSKENLVVMMKLPDQTSNRLLNNGNGNLLTGTNLANLTSTIAGVNTLTNQFIFPQLTLFEGAKNPMLPQDPLDTMKNMVVPSSSQAKSTPTLLPSEIVAASAAAEAAGIKLPSISSLNTISGPGPSALPTPPPVHSNPGPQKAMNSEEHTMAILRLKASNTKNRTEQAKLLLEYYQTCENYFIF